MLIIILVYFKLFWLNTFDILNWLFRYCKFCFNDVISTPVSKFCLADVDKTYWEENYAGSSGFSAPLADTPDPFVDIHHLQMDKSVQPLTPLPLLSQPKEYTPDTVDLSLDREARSVHY